MELLKEKVVTRMVSGYYTDIHAIYGDNEIVIALDGEILEGEFPTKQLRMLEGWMSIHEDELYANWQMLKEGEGFFKIEPLR